MNRNTLLLLTGVCLLSALVSSLMTFILVRGTGDAHAATAFQDEPISSKKFVLLDGRGTPKAVWTTNREDNLPRITFMDNEGEVGLSIGTLMKEGTGGVTLLDKEGKVRLLLAIKKEGDPTITLANRKGEAVAAIWVQNDKGAFFSSGEHK